MSSTDDPLFTVIMATYGRGRFILPSVRSVLAQTLTDFELLVIGDHCTDETADAVAGLAHSQVRWINLPDRWHSQSGPNNAGILAARGRHVAYIGHDDIWEPFHLADLARVFAAQVAPDFAVGGCILHNPNGLPGHRVTGLFDTDDAKHLHFFPPSSLAHRRDVTDRIGPWQRPDDVASPVDRDLLLRAAAADLRFASTGRVSVHKFTASQRYLSYLCVSDEEQVAMLSKMAEPGHAGRVDAILAEAQAMDTHMSIALNTFETWAVGKTAEVSRQVRGVVLPDLQPVGAGAVMEQQPMHCGMDWRSEPVFGIRWVGPNPQPRVLVPFTADAPVRLVLQVVHEDPAALTAFDLSCNGIPAKAHTNPPAPRGRLWQTQMRVRLRLRPDAASTLEFRLTPLQAMAKGRRGIGIGRMSVMPMPEPAV